MGWLELLPLLKRVLPLLDRLAPLLESLVAGRLGARAELERVNTAQAAAGELATRQSAELAAALKLQGEQIAAIHAEMDELRRTHEGAVAKLRALEELGMRQWRLLTAALVMVAVSLAALILITRMPR